MRSRKTMNRRTSFNRLARAALIAAVVAGLASLPRCSTNVFGPHAEKPIGPLPLCGAHTFSSEADRPFGPIAFIPPCPAEAFGSKIDLRWRPLVTALTDYLNYAYATHDEQKAEATLESLKTYGIEKSDVAPLQNVNRRLMANHLFLMCFNTDSGRMPVVKLFLIATTDVFDGFTVGDRKKTTLFGRELGTYRRVLLGEEVFSSADVPPVALSYNLAEKTSRNPDWVIAIPSGWIRGLYGSGGMQERLVEELTIHEIAHIVYETRDELLPFLAQFGYLMDDDRPITSVGDLIAYLKNRRLTYHEPERLILERIFHAEDHYGISGNIEHLMALWHIKDALTELSEEVNRQDRTYPRDPLKMSDQQCYASMALLYYRELKRLQH